MLRECIIACCHCITILCISALQDGPLKLFYIVFDTTVANLEFYIPTMPTEVPIVTEATHCKKHRETESMEADMDYSETELFEADKDSKTEAEESEHKDSKVDIIRNILKDTKPPQMDTLKPLKTVIKREIVSPVEDIVANPDE